MAFEQTIQQINEIIDQQLAPGLDYFVMEHGQIIADETVGYAQLKPSKIELKQNQLFDVASLTKIMGTVPVIMQLIEENKVALDDQVSEFFPQIKDERVLIRHLITHTSGVEGWIENRDELNASELRAALYKSVSFGAGFNKKVVYNDYNFLLLGFIAERLLHQPIQSLIQTRILNELGLPEATFKPSPLKTVSTEVRNDITTRGLVHDPKAFSLKEHSGSAGLFACKFDLLVFTQWMLGLDTDKSPLTQQTMNLFDSNQTANPNLSRSMGWAIEQSSEGNMILRHSGFTGTFILLDRKTKNAVVVLTNRLHPTPNIDFLTLRQQIYDTFAREDK
ncbi:serine hydrolase domain-containing protein [Pediococcus argentinicus]|uniref:serine hydrolase domain-containing protein n=1 Tax=Pediococcus argentinicus TaxID=480391 RepID=UPI00338D58F8